MATARVIIYVLRALLVYGLSRISSTLLLASVISQGARTVLAKKGASRNGNAAEMVTVIGLRLSTIAALVSHARRECGQGLDTPT